MTTLTPDITLLHSETVELERTLLAQGLGLVRSLRAGTITPEEAQTRLFDPEIGCDLAERGVGADVIAFLEKGYFLDDVQGIMGERGLNTVLDDMEVAALKLLERRSPSHFCAWTMTKKETLKRKLSGVSFILPRTTS